MFTFLSFAMLNLFAIATINAGAAVAPIWAWVTSGAIVAVIWSFADNVITKVINPSAVSTGTQLGDLAGAAILSTVPTSFRPLVQTELTALAANSGADALTVKEAAATILAKVSPVVPTATIADVLDVISEMTNAFVAGLAPAPPAARPITELPGLSAPIK